MGRNVLSSQDFINILSGVEFETTNTRKIFLRLQHEIEDSNKMFTLQFCGTASTSPTVINIQYERCRGPMRHTVAIREIETTFFDPASVFLSTHWWSQKPASQFLAKEACSFYKRDLFRRFSAHPASVFLKHSGRNWAKSRLQFLSASFYVPEWPCMCSQVCVVNLISYCRMCSLTTGSFRHIETGT